MPDEKIFAPAKKVSSFSEGGFSIRTDPSGSIKIKEIGDPVAGSDIPDSSFDDDKKYNLERVNQSSDKSITSFVFSGLTPKVDGVIDNLNYAINLTVSSDTDVTSLTPTISVSDNATVSPLSGVAQDFTNPVIYSVTAQDGSTQNYTVTVTSVSAQ